MGYLQSTLAFLTLLAACNAYICPDDGKTFYHADVATGCQVYHLCEGSEMKTLTCPPGQAFDHHVNQCNNASLVHCTETEHHHHHNKRSVELAFSVSIEDLKNSTKEVLKTIKSIVGQTLQEAVPTLYDHILSDYVKIIESLKTDYEPIIMNHVLPRMKKFNDYARRMSGKIFKKIYQSYEVSNSTHVNVVSFADEIDEILEDIEPLLKLGKYFASRLVKSTRAKRDANVPESFNHELLEINHHLNKRYVEVVHSLSIDELKNTIEETLKAIKSILRKTLQETAPSVLDRIDEEYVPIIRSLIDDYEPIFRKHILPRIEKFHLYAKRMGGKIFKKVQRSYELSNSTHINLVSCSDEFDEIVADIEPLLKLGRYFSSRLIKNSRIKREVEADNVPELLKLNHYLNKRSVEVVHSLSIDELKNTIKGTLKTIKSILRNTLKEAAPEIFYRIDKEYVPMIISLKDDYEPIFKKHILPRIEKFHLYTKQMGGKIFKKVQRSYELSNSTHINLVSFSNEFNEILADIEPLLKLGRFFSSRLVKNSRVKRDTGTPITEVPELLIGYLEPVLKEMFASMTSMFSGDENTLTSRVIMPVMFEIMNDEESMLSVKKIFWSSKAAFSPLVFDMLNRQSFHNPDGTIIHVPQDKIARAKEFFYKETKPVIKKLCEKHLPSLLMKCSQNTQLIFAAIDRVTFLSTKGSGLVLRDDIVRFVRKHAEALQSVSSASHISSYALTEIKQDLRPIEVGLLQMALDYVDQQEDSWLKIFFGRNSFLTQGLLGDRETYAAPSGTHQGSAIISSIRETFAVPSGTYQNSARPSPIRQSNTFAVPRGTYQSSAIPSSIRETFAVPSGTYQNPARPSPIRQSNTFAVPSRTRQSSATTSSRGQSSTFTGSRGTYQNAARPSSIRGSPKVGVSREEANMPNWWYNRYLQALQG